MKPLLALAAALSLGACIEETGSDSSQVMAPDRQLLIYFNSGFDEPPTGGILRSCDAPSGLCVTIGPTQSHPLTRTASGWEYSDGSFRHVLSNDGTGVIQNPYGESPSVSWMTEPWDM